ncbi:MAG TPA: iron-containing alcohol dehydrogenase [Streptosporangiaceae bacterium]|nr:iron-containing alcohol dehydrogenase [Streptosporangiaceae bacterium]
MSGFVIEPKPAAHFGVGAVGKLPGIVRGVGADHVVVVTDAALAVSPVLTQVLDILLDAGLPCHVFSGVHPNPTTDDLAAGAAAVADAAAHAAVAEAAATVAATLKASAPAAPGTSAPGGIALVAVGGGSPIDAAKGIALAAANPERGRSVALEAGRVRGHFAVPGLPIVAVPTTAGTGAEANPFGVVTDAATHRAFYAGHASTMPAAAILDPALTVGLSPAATAATGIDALTHALESYLSLRPNPWSDGLALQAIRMIAANLPRAVRDGTDTEARSQLLLAAHLAGVAMADTGLGVCHAIGHSLGGRWNISHGVALSMLLPDVLRFNLPVRTQRLADIAFALSIGDTHQTQARNAAAAIDAVAALRDRIGLTAVLVDFGITEADFAQIAADALDDEVLLSAPRPPTQAHIRALLSGRVD